MTSILMAEDEERISTFVEKGLRAAGFDCTIAADGATALALGQSGQFQLMILDIGLPVLNGFEVLRRLRRTDASIPIIMLTARHSIDDTVAGLDDGANDYLTKPFRLDELLARIRLRLRESGASEGSELRHGSLRLDLRTRKGQVGDAVVELSAREFALAEEFLKHPGQVLTHEQLLSRVWGYDFDPTSNVVEVYVRYLRTKLGPDVIETIRGTGYRLR
jgi:DNA-binding response OmpR family regulator